MQQSTTEPTQKPGSQDEEQPEGKIVRLTPRRAEPETRREPPVQDDDGDPGPSAA